MPPRLVLAAALALLSPAAAQAQYQMVSPMLYNGPQISLQNHADRSRTTGPNAANPAPEAAVDPGTLRYRPDPARTKANQAQFVAKTRAVDPAGADQLAQLFASTDVMAQVKTAIAPHGMRVDDLADAYTTYWITAWAATRGHNDTPDAATIAAVKGQATRAMAATPLPCGASDATKQELAESLWVQSALLDSSVEQAKGKPDQLKAIAAAAAQGARGMGLDLAGMTLTQKGFVAAK